jgi:hypothetical protein
MRRNTYNTRNPYLPMTEEDVVRRLLHQKTRRLMRKRKKALGRWLARINTPVFVLGSICALFATGGLVHLLWLRHRRHVQRSSLPSTGGAAASLPLHGSPHDAAAKKKKQRQQQEAPDGRDVMVAAGRNALQEFPSLEYALSNSKLVALYFAASWCPMSTPVSEILDRDEFASLLVPPPPMAGHSDNPAKKSPADKKDPNGQPDPLVALVYVSSDQSHEQMAKYLANRPKWMYIPYDSVDRTRLKQHFQTAAKVEMKELSMESRKHEIPTLVVIDSESQQVLTFNGVKDVKEAASSSSSQGGESEAAATDSTGGGDVRRAVETWLELARLSQALDAKFDRDDAKVPS